MLALMARRVGYWAGNLWPGLQPFNLGDAFAFWVSLDAFIVLSGAVLTAYVGISGLIARMAKDRCLPQFILRRVYIYIYFQVCKVWCVFFFKLSVFD